MFNRKSFEFFKTFIIFASDKCYVTFVLNCCPWYFGSKVAFVVNGGALWFSNLTMAGPYYILPWLSCVCLHLLIRLGGATEKVDPTEIVPFFKKVCYGPLLFSIFGSFPLRLYVYILDDE